MKKINIIMHYPKDDDTVTKLQNETNKAYILSIEKILNRSKIPIENKKELLSNVICDETFMIGSI